jgi:hypothetical protein
MSDDIRIESTITRTDQLKTNSPADAESNSKKRRNRKPPLEQTIPGEPAADAVQPDGQETHRLDILI